MKPLPTLKLNKTSLSLSHLRYYCNFIIIPFEAFEYFGVDPVHHLFFASSYSRFAYGPYKVEMQIWNED